MKHRAANRNPCSLFAAVLSLLFLWIGGASAAERVPWTTSRLHGSPEKPHPFRLTRILSGLQFTNPVDFAYAPEMKRWFLAVQGGQIYSFPHEQAVNKPDLLVDLTPVHGKGGSLFALTLDPGFATNRYLYVCYALEGEKPDGSHISRFVVSQNEPPTVDPRSEKVIITWLSGGHNGCCLKFGPDGYLYISTGDAAGPNPPDPLNTGQDLSDLLSSILRIDVHAQDPGRAYRVPSDNPFLNMPGVRPEIWAYGFRNPWRMCFDKKSGDFWVSDVGWELWELVYKVERGGNYGWSIVEGRQPVNANSKRGPTPILPPTKDHPHHEAASITGGVVYYGAKYPQLSGAHIYGDWETGKIWALRAEKDRVIFCDEIADSTTRIIAFAEDPEGEVCVLDYNGGIYLLEKNPAPDTSADFPTRLSQTGILKSTQDHSVAAGVYPFQVLAEMWADHARAQRFVALPRSSSIETGKQPWVFPTNAVLAKTLSLQTKRGNPQSERRIETQVLHFDGTDWRGYSFRWNEAGTDAELVPAQGAESVLRVKDAREPGGWRDQRYRFHSRAECLRCHNTWCGTALGFKPEQLSRSALSELRALNIFAKEPEQNFALVNPHEATADLSKRARSYLHANCSHCHRQNAGGSVPTELNYEVPLAKTKALNARPVLGDFGLERGKVIAPGEPFSSALLFRMSSTGRSRMPYIGSDFVDEQGIKLLREWIAQLDPNTESAFTRSRAELSSTNCDVGTVAASAANTSSALMLAHALGESSRPVEFKEALARESIKQPNPLVRELMERFLPSDLRTVRRQTEGRPEDALALRGDPARGRELYGDAARLSCSQCHPMNGVGRAFGPDLAQIAKKQSRRQLLENIIYPSNQVAPEFTIYAAEVSDEEQYTGILVRKSEKEILLRDAALNEIKLPADKVKSLRAQNLSAMPEGLLSGLTPQEIADLLEYIVSMAN